MAVYDIQIMKNDMLVVDEHRYKYITVDKLSKYANINSSLEEIVRVYIADADMEITSVLI